MSWLTFSRRSTEPSRKSSRFCGRPRRFPRTTNRPPFSGEEIDRELAAARLGVGTGLYTALWCKHPPSAAHGLRVALTTSVWAAYQNLNDSERESIEIAALLHDIGLVGVPDGVLAKGSSLQPDERCLFQKVPLSSMRILRSSGADTAILENVAYARAWYDGTKPGYDRARKDIPRGARMIGIVEAFDSMITNHVFRAAMEFEEVREEMFRGAGSQFDPDLLEEFYSFSESDHIALRRKWLLGGFTNWIRASWNTTGNTTTCHKTPEKQNVGSKRGF